VGGPARANTLANPTAEGASDAQIAWNGFLQWRKRPDSIGIERPEGKGHGVAVLLRLRHACVIKA
jgi:hypothetical protein